MKYQVKCCPSVKNLGIVYLLAMLEPALHLITQIKKNLIHGEILKESHGIVCTLASPLRVQADSKINMGRQEPRPTYLE
jgi:hypothetical protein